MFSRLFWIIFHFFSTIWKKSYILVLGQFTRGSMSRSLNFTKTCQNFFFWQLNCIVMLYDCIIIINRCTWVRRMFSICVTFPRNKKKVFWCLQKLPCRFRPKVLLEGESWNESSPKSMFEAHVLHFLSSDVILRAFVKCYEHTKWYPGLGTFNGTETWKTNSI